MARPKSKAPARRFHLAGQSVVTIGGGDFCLGPHDSPESIARYAVLIGICQANGLPLPKEFDPAMLDVQAATDQSKQPTLVRHVPAADYNALRLQAQRQRWIDSGKVRVYCKRLTNSVKRI